MTKKAYFNSVETKPDFPEMERKLLDWWYESGLVDDYLKKNDGQKKTFSFMDGPITANNPMGVHHAWGRTYKDLWQRYKNMQGFAQRFQNGFDCQGLWVEVEVEKALGFKSKKEIEKYGIAKFVKRCQERVRKYARIQTRQSKRLGYFMDWDNSYYTMSDENNYMIWHFLKRCWQKGWLYQGKDSVPWCPRCGTAISQHEMLTEDYKQVTHQAVYFKLPITTSGWEKRFFLAWTTTPWTIPGNVALVVDPRQDYLMVKEGNDWLIVIKNQAQAVFSNLKARQSQLIKGKELTGLTYEAPFDHLPRVKKAMAGQTHRVVGADPVILPVAEEEGTGVVHVATGAGSEDYQLGQKEDLPLIELIDEQARYLEGMKELSGANAKQHPGLVLDCLKAQDNGRFFYRVEPFSHRYPACWRCKEELVWRAVKEWYIAMDKKDPDDPKGRTLREKMIQVAKQINWIPEFGLKRELDWLKNMNDWLISKKRYWGLALPIWQCDCGEILVIGSEAELKEKALSGWREVAENSPHRPWVDQIKVKCPKCQQSCSRIKDVGNPWLDAGIVSFSTLIDPQTGKLSYLTDKKYFKRWFPADFITESFPGQFKNWFYSMIAMATVLEDQAPYKTVLGFGTLLAEDGRPMHKSWGNAIEFNKGADKIGVDVMRWMYISHQPEKNLLFGYQVADETRRKFHLTLWNVYNFFVTYANLNHWQPKKLSSQKLSLLDRWILARLDQVCLEVTEHLDGWQPDLAAETIEKFVQDLSTWYVRRSRQRVSLNYEDQQDKQFCLAVLHQTLLVLSRVLAPMTPFMAEKIYQNLTKKRSVHLESWPKVNQEDFKAEDRKLIAQMELVRDICELGHSTRKKAGIKVRQPLQSIKVKAEQAELKPALLSLIKAELNIKQVDWQRTEAEGLTVDLDTQLTDQLKAEGQARDLIRKIQWARKRAGCDLAEKVIVYLPAWPESQEEEIKSKTLAKELKKAKKLKIVRLES